MINEQNAVIFKSNKGGISILLDSSLPFDSLKEIFLTKIEAASKFFEGVKTSILFKGRSLSENEEKELLDIIAKSTNMNISYFSTEGLDEENVKPTLLSGEFQQFNITKYHKGNIRSGQSIEFNGSVVVIGDINPGGEVKAEGNIIVLGALKGIAHAGCNGMKEAFVSALIMAPVQLRIADIITRFPEEELLSLDKVPEYAYVENGQIFVMPLQ